MRGALRQVVSAAGLLSAWCYHEGGGDTLCWTGWDEHTPDIPEYVHRVSCDGAQVD